MIAENWEAALALFLLLAVLLYDAVHLIIPKKIPLANADAASYIIMAMLGSLTVMLLRVHGKDNSKKIDTLAESVIRDYSGRNPFLENWLRSKLEFLPGLKNGSFGDTIPFYASDLIEALRCAKAGDELQAIDYGPGWKPKFELLQRENIEARARGVLITRIFIVPESIANEAQQAKSLWETMVEQAAHDIAVKWVAQCDLSGAFPDLVRSSRGMALFRYGPMDCGLLMLDAPNAHLVLMGGEDPAMELCWNDHQELRQRMKEFRELGGLKILKTVSGSEDPAEPPFLMGKIAKGGAASALGATGKG